MNKLIHSYFILIYLHTEFIGLSNKIVRTLINYQNIIILTLLGPCYLYQSFNITLSLKSATFEPATAA